MSITALFRESAVRATNATHSWCLLRRRRAPIAGTAAVQSARGTLRSRRSGRLLIRGIRTRAARKKKFCLERSGRRGCSESLVSGSVGPATNATHSSWRVRRRASNVGMRNARSACASRECLPCVSQLQITLTQRTGTRRTQSRSTQKLSGLLTRSSRLSLLRPQQANDLLCSLPFLMLHEGVSRYWLKMSVFGSEKALCLRHTDFRCFHDDQRQLHT